ncbi:MAG: heavy-metal-associated domain-containing protein [Flavobacteriia bacterium]|nr:heavy-metal-associated domain-containing protein [Flavobacteriia bacterium]
METMKFKTNINCSGCVQKVTPVLNHVKSIQKWEVDIANPEKILVVESTDDNMYEIIEVVKQAGFTIEKI